MKPSIISNSVKFLIISLSLLFSFQALSLEVISLNIKWFGRGGDLYGSIEDENRTEHLIDYIHDELPKADVFVFQEIVDKEGLYQIMKDYECFSYDAGTSSHQFVVMCSKPGLLIRSDVNQESRLDRLGLRAAVIGDYKDGGDKVTRLIGVHLKAGRGSTVTRLNQIHELKVDLNEDMPTMIVGDFNTYKSDKTFFLEDDSLLISQSLGEEFTLAKNQIPTYMGFGGRVFDRAWGRGFLNLKASVYGPCSGESVEPPYSDKYYYRDFISDHCALKITTQ